MKQKKWNSYVEFAELIRANVSGPIKHKMIAKAQERLIKRLKQNGIVTNGETNDLLV